MTCYYDTLSEVNNGHKRKKIHSELCLSRQPTVVPVLDSKGLDFGRERQSLLPNYYVGPNRLATMVTL